MKSTNGNPQSSIMPKDSFVIKFQLWHICMFIYLQQKASARDLYKWSLEDSFPFLFFFQCGYFRVLAGVHDRRRCDSRRAQYYQETLRIAQTVGSTHGPLAATRRSVLPPRRHNPIVFEQQVCIWDLLLREKNTNTCFSFSIVCLVHLFCLQCFFSRSSLNRIVHKSLRDVVIVRSSTIYVNDFFYSKDDSF